jgi:23S rRNA (guanosine2251-2'-O)-methyltransferase
MGGRPAGGRPAGGRPRPGNDRPRFDDRRPPAPFEGSARDFGDPPGPPDAAAGSDAAAGPDVDAVEATERQNRPWIDRGPRPGGPRRPGQWERPGGPGRFVRPGAPAPPLEEGEELVAGRRPVEEAFAAGRPARRLLVTPQRRQALERIVLHATTLRIPIVEVEGGSLTSLAGFDGHQGVAVVVDARRFASVDDILARSIEHGEPAFVLVLDSLEDPQNVGTLLRSAEAAGVHGVIFPTARQAPLSPAAIKASAGATEHLLLAPVDDLAGTLTDLHLRGLRIVGSDAEASLSAREADLRGPIAIVIGSEGHGVAPAIRRRSDMFVRIPMRGAIGSLNAAVAGSVLLFEALGQREPDARPSPPVPPPRPVAAVLPDDSAAAADAAAPDVQADVEAPADLPVTAERPAPKRTRTRLTAEDLDTAASTPDDEAAAAAAAEPEPGSEAAPRPKAARTRKASNAEPAPEVATPPKAPRARKATTAKPAPEAATAPRAGRARKAATAAATAEPPASDPGDDALLPDAPPKPPGTKGRSRGA